MNENLKGYHLNKTGDRVKQLLDRQFIVPTLNHIPNAQTKTWQDGEYTVEFRIGELCRIKVDNEWEFYRLHDIINGGYVWKKTDTADTSSNYTAVIDMISLNFNAVSYGSTGNYIEFTFDTLNKNDQSVSEDVTCTYTIVRGSSKKVITERYRYGTQVKFNVDKYLKEGTNTITIRIVGNNTFADTSVGVTYQVVNLLVSSTYDISKIYNLYSNPNEVAEIPYSIQGTGTKTIEWYLDGKQLPFESTDEIVEVSATKTKYINLSGLQQGTHNIQFRAYVTVNGEKFYSDVVYMGIMVYTLTDRNPLIAVAITNPSDKDIITDELTIYGIEQYSPYTFRIAVYNPQGSAYTETSIYTNNDLQGIVAITNGAQTEYTIRLSSIGSVILRIETGTSQFTANLQVEKSSANLSENTANLLLNLSAIGRSNMESARNKWVYKDYFTTFDGFQWNDTSGWNNNRLLIADGAGIEINIAPFANRNVTSTGLTIEMEFSTLKVNDENAILCDLRNNSGKGLLLTASEASLTSTGDSLVTTKYKSGENIRISFVVNPATGAMNKGLAFIYIDGILSGASRFAENDNFLSDALLKIGKTTNAAIALKQILIYDRALSNDEILNNYILYRDTNAEMMDIYDRNNIMDGRQVDLDALAAQCPVLKITGNIPVLENTTDKDETIYVDVEYVNMQNPSYSFTGTYLRMKPQGTSSMGYPKKNFRLYTTKHQDSRIYDSEGREIVNRLYSFKPGAQPVDCWCFKADYAESSGTHNTGIARLWGKVMYDALIDGEYKLRTNAQKIAAANGYPYDVRTTIDGFPCHLVYRLDETLEWIYIGKYNFNNDKSTESVFGFTGIDGFDNSHMQCWEVLNNGNHLALFEDVENFDSEWSEAYESRYPDTKTPNTADLKAFCKWVVSTKGNVEKFSTEKWQHMDVYKAAAYYVYAMRFGAVDQIVKNSMLTSEDGKLFYWINYDNDTINGLRNDGLLVFGYTIDRQSLDPSYTEPVYVYAGHSSTLWNNMEADAEFMDIVAKVDDALYVAGLKYSEVIKMFDQEQSAKWGERVYNLDAQYKYISPYNDNGINNLFMLQGARRSHRRWWLSNRFDLIDSMFVSGKYKANIVDFKVMNDTPIGQQFSIQSGNLLYYGYGVNDIPVETGVKLEPGEEKTFTTKQVLNIGDPVRIYSAQNLQKIDLSPLMGRLTQLGVAGVYDEINGSKLKKLILGNGTSINTGLSEISGLDMAKSLEELDIRGMKGLNNVNISSLQLLKTFLSEGSGLKSFSPAKGAILTTVTLPDTITALTLNSLAYLKSYTVSGGVRNLTTIQIFDCPYLTSDFTYYLNWYNNKNTQDKMCTLELDNVDWKEINPIDLIHLGQLKINGGLFKLKGKCSITESSEEIVSQLSEIFGSNCFDKNAEFYISAPDAIYLTGPDELMEGESAQFTAAVFSQFKGKIEWSITSGNTSYQTIDQYGFLTTQYQGFARTITIRAMHIPTQGSVVSVSKQINIIKQVRPTQGTINGEDYASNGSAYSLSVKPTDINTEYSVQWSLRGTAYDEGSVAIREQDKTNCILDIASGRQGSFTLVASIIDVAGNVIEVTKSLTIGVKVSFVIKTNQPDDDSASNLKATVKVDNGSAQYFTNDSFLHVNIGSRVTVSYPSLSNYRTPNNYDIVVGESNISITGVYSTEVLTVNLSSYDGGDLNGTIIKIRGAQHTWEGVPIIEKIPFDTNYFIEPSAVTTYLKPDVLQFVASEVSRNINIEYGPIPSDMVIINQSISDPATMISGGINSSIIQEIRNESHRYLGKYTGEKEMTLCQLDDNDSTKYVDGSEAILTGEHGDVFMKLPEFWYRIVEMGTDKYGIQFKKSDPQSQSWVKWDTDAIIGVYKAVLLEEKLRSVVNGVNTTQAFRAKYRELENYISARGSGFQLVDYQMHCIMIFLFFAQYGHTNSQEKIGIGQNGILGSSNSSGMNDTKGSIPIIGLNDNGVDGNNNPINFWGLESWWGNPEEIISNVVIKQYKTYITEPDGSVHTMNSTFYADGYISKFHFSSKGYITVRSVGATGTTGFCDNGCMNTAHGYYQYVHRLARAGYFTNSANNGISYLSTADSDENPLSYSSRLAFRGTCVIQNDTDVFKSLNPIS